jgi:hypothetical protein
LHHLYKGLGSRDAEAKVHSVLQETLKAVKFVEASPLNSRLGAISCEEMQADDNSLL